MKYLFLIVSFFVSLFIFKPEANASNIFFVKKNIKMQNDQETQHDYYLNAGSKEGLKAGMLIRVNRKVPFQDTSMLKSNEQLEVPVVELKLIHVQDSISVGRVNQILVTDESPILDYNAIMIGDSVDLSSKKWPAKANVNKASNSDSEAKASAKVQVKKEDSLELSSVTAKEERKNTEAPVDLEKDQRAQSIPIGGELSSPPTTF